LLRFAQNDTGRRSRNPKGEQPRGSDLAGNEISGKMRDIFSCFLLSITAHKTGLRQGIGNGACGGFLPRIYKYCRFSKILFTNDEK